MGFWTKKRIIVGISGGIAAYKMPELIRRLRDEASEVIVVTTEAALNFVTRLTLQTVANGPVYSDLFSLEHEREIGHIRLAREADLLLIAPATANLLAKMAGGQADDLLSTIYLARRGPVLVAPAMNTAMWEHPATQRNIARLRGDGVSLVGPAHGELACGESGLGRMSPIEEILATAASLLSPKPLLGKRILLTAGPTREALDPVRYLSNHSSGKMGWAVAKAAQRAGAEVILVHGPTALPPPPGVQTRAVTSAVEMFDEAMAFWPSCDVAIMTAAVSDYRPVVRQTEKIKKQVGEERLSLELTLNPDILATLAAHRRPDQVVVGFAAETTEEMTVWRDKLQRKGCHLLAVNNILEEGSGFGGDTNRVTLLTPENGIERWPLLSKDEVAQRLLETIIRLPEFRRESPL